MNCRYRNDTYSFSSMLYSTFKTASFSKSTHYIYTTLKYLNHWANCLHIQNLTVTKNASLLSASNLSPLLFFCSSLAAAVTASWNNDREECDWAQQAHGNSGAISYRTCGQIIPFLLSIRSVSVYDEVWLGLWRWLSADNSRYLSSPCENKVMGGGVLSGKVVKRGETCKIQTGLEVMIPKPRVPLSVWSGNLRWHGRGRMFCRCLQ